MDGWEQGQLVEDSSRIPWYEQHWELTARAEEYIQHEVKQKTKDELVNGIYAFWDTVDVQKCTKYINHLRKVHVIPKVIELNGAATGY